ncbi:MAG TPA: ATP-binding protein [Clostridia bacterium]|nr:ATP-binding protein [Clostridia bacterium]
MKELSLNILDIAQNSIKANAAHLTIRLTKTGSRLTVEIADDGTGMSPDFVQEAANPFTTTRTTRKVGMGLPLFKLAAEQTGGTFSIVSQQAQREGDAHGTTVTATFDTAHVDCEPLGDITETILALIQGNPDLSLTYEWISEAGEQRLSTDEMREILGEDVPLNSPDVLAWARAYLNGEE